MFAGKVTPRPPSRATHYSPSPETHGGAYLSYSYTPSPTAGLPNGTPTQYHAPNVTLGLHNFPTDAPGEDNHNNHLHHLHHHHQQPIVGGVEISEEAYHNLGLDNTPPPTMGLEQHSIPSEPTSLTLDPHSITIDHHHHHQHQQQQQQQLPTHHHSSVSMADHMRHDAPMSTFDVPTPMSTFQPGVRQQAPPPPSPPNPSHMEGHLV